MKVVVFLVLAVLSFIITLVAALGLTGGLSKDGFDRLLGRAKPEPVAAAAAEDPNAPDELAKQASELKSKEEDLAKRETRVQEDEKRLKETQAQLDELRTTLQTMMQDLTKTVDTADADRKTRMQAIAQSLGGMKPAQAAKAIEAWTPEDAAELLALVDDRARGKILDGMDPEKASAILQAMQ